MMSYYFHQYIDYRLKNTHPVYTTEQKKGDQFFTSLQWLKYDTTEKKKQPRIKPVKYRSLLRIASLHKLFQHFGSRYTKIPEQAQVDQLLLIHIPYSLICQYQYQLILQDRKLVSTLKLET